jgi:hypothetical protein
LAGVREILTSEGRDVAADGMKDDAIGKDRLDLVRSDARYYGASTTPELVEIGTVRILVVEGRGQPGGPAHLAAIESLYSVIERVRDFAEGSAPFVVPPLEGLWWVEGDRPALEVPREDWQWQLQVRLPDVADSEWVELAREQVSEAARDVRLTSLAEGLCVQALHRGPYESEPETIAAMDALMERERLTMNGHHHEIYLTAVTEQIPPHEIRTILRHPVRPLDR